MEKGISANLTLVCRKCTRQSVFCFASMATAVKVAQADGWLLDGNDYICPKCPTAKRIIERTPSK
jgi:hypothetical protein